MPRNAGTPWSIVPASRPPSTCTVGRTCVASLIAAPMPRCWAPWCSQPVEGRRRCQSAAAAQEVADEDSEDREQPADAGPEQQRLHVAAHTTGGGGGLAREDLRSGSGGRLGLRRRHP